MTATLKKWALYYAGRGLAVFPLRPRDKRPATENGCKAATTNEQQIADWWDRYPDCNIGIATGSLSGGLVVIDLDIDEEKGINGYDSLKAWQRENGELPETWQSITGRGGYHLSLALLCRFPHVVTEVCLSVCEYLFQPLTAFSFAHLPLRSTFLAHTHVYVWFY